MNIILAGPMGRYPFGGVAWCSMMYLLGLRRLGHQVWYLEDTGQCNYDPPRNGLSRNPQYALDFVHSCLAQYGMGDRWCYIDFKGGYHGHDRRAWRRVCSEADLFLNLSGGCWFWRDEYLRIPHSAYIDSDPAFTQQDIAERGPGHAAFFEQFSALFTFGRNIGTPACPIPTEPLHWEHTWQPVCMEEWRPSADAPRPFFTTVLTWKVNKFKRFGGNKDSEFMKVLDLPSRVVQGAKYVPGVAHNGHEAQKYGLEVAVSGPHELLREHGWQTRDAFSVSHNLDSYRDYIRSSLGEFSVAKQLYVQSNSGWFSDRTECYLASGRPAAVQDTGFSAHIPTGEGLFAFRTVEDALAGLEAIVSDYERHSRAAHEVVRAHFAAEVVLPPLIERATRQSSGAKQAAQKG